MAPDDDNGPSANDAPGHALQAGRLNNPRVLRTRADTLSMPLEVQCANARKPGHVPPIRVSPSGFGMSRSFVTLIPWNRTPPTKCPCLRIPLRIFCVPTVARGCRLPARRSPSFSARSVKPSSLLLLPIRRTTPVGEQDEPDEEKQAYDAELRANSASRRMVTERPSGVSHAAFLSHHRDNVGMRVHHVDAVRLHAFRTVRLRPDFAPMRLRPVRRSQRQSEP